MNGNACFYVLYYLYQAMTESDSLGYPGGGFCSIIRFAHCQGMKGGHGLFKPRLHSMFFKGISTEYWLEK